MPIDARCVTPTGLIRSDDHPGSDDQVTEQRGASTAAAAATTSEAINANAGHPRKVGRRVTMT